MRALSTGGVVPVGKLVQTGGSRPVLMRDFLAVGSSIGRHNFEEMINYATWESIPNKGNELVFVVFES